MGKQEPLKLGDKEMAWDTVGSSIRIERLRGVPEIEEDFAFEVQSPLEEACKSGGRYSIKRIYSKVGAEEYILKRPFDILLSSLGIILALPLWLLIVLAIWKEDGRPILYRSNRVGKRCRVFTAFKFRSMIVDSDQQFALLQAAENDQRITRVGKILRATAMDEFPQLWNVFKGDMSMVGPRALLPAEIEVKGFLSNGGTEAVPLEKIPGYRKRHSVRPGLTGAAQIYAPRDVARRQKFRYDMIYIKQQNLWLDVKLIILSFWIALRGRWESRTNKF